MPTMRRTRDNIALGGQQAQRLQQLRDASEDHIHQTHLLRESEPLPPSGSLGIDGNGRSSRTSRTVEAIIEQRTHEKSEEEGGGTAARFREKIRKARGGIQTERSEERPRYATNTAPMARVRQRIVAIRRPGNKEYGGGRRLTKEEIEWFEKQRQFTQRIGVMEKECSSWWQQFYSSAGISTTDRANETWALTQSIQKQLEECDKARHDDTKVLYARLRGLRDKTDAVSHTIAQMRDGKEPAVNLQVLMDELEQSLGQLRRTQRVRYDEYVVEEKMLERDLSQMLEKLDEWDSERIQLATTSQSKAPQRRLAPSSSKEQLDRSPPHSPLENKQQEEAFIPSQEDEEDLVKRVRRLNDRILQSGGLRGGWDERDHAVFASTLVKCGLTDEILMANYLPPSSNQDDFPHGSPLPTNDYESQVARFVRKCTKAVVTRTSNAVRQHLEWYIGHLQLVQDKKDAIQQWKERKKVERQQVIAQGVDCITDQGDSINLPGGTEEEKDLVARQRKLELEAKSREKKNQQLAEWKEEKARKEREKAEQLAAQRQRREGMEAKKRQELLEKKQQIMLYKLQKEQDTALLQRKSPLTSSSSPAKSPESQEELQERSRKAIELAKSKRAKLQALEERRLKQQELPARPKSVIRRTSGTRSQEGSPTDTSESTLLRPTKTFEARNLSKPDLKRQEKLRERQGAHDGYFPGAGMTSDVKIKSFGHIPIAPRAVPAWRRNI
ncbi:hypothetical protein Poli38472_008767 [Pythium oligandrum]|uniref:Uncharacterized protein n=1 Tax=Pythium oligandrum TaxID=41045 RepID=A0A8K1C464_PYTOL|nr:hypothetical protein Poli38472_008767 [Pythium oligandrum]|eukprot:TMW56119.1 hypothetical protein Poli38472_008767 [Pythium oligandrum]